MTQSEQEVKSWAILQKATLKTLARDLAERMSWSQGVAYNVLTGLFEYSEKDKIKALRSAKRADL